MIGVSVPRETLSDAIMWLRRVQKPSCWPRTPTGNPAMITDPAWGNTLSGVAFSDAAWPLIRWAVPDAIPEVNVRNVWLSALLPGQTIDPHCDQVDPGFRWRIHIPLMSNDDAAFIQDGKAHVLEVGWAYRIDPRRKHAVWNAGTTPRVHLMFDLFGAAS